MNYNLLKMTPVGFCVTVGAAALGIWLTVRSIRTREARPAVCILFTLYAVCLAVVTMGPVEPGEEPALGETLGNTLMQLYWAFRFDVRYLEVQYLLNILLFVPLGILVPMINSRMGKWRRAALLSLGTSAAIELLQLLSGSNRVCDWADILCNTLGGLLGFGIFLLAARRRCAGSWNFAASACLCGFCLLLFMRPALPFPDDPFTPDSRYGLPGAVYGSLDRAEGASPNDVRILSVRRDEPHAAQRLEDLRSDSGFWPLSAATGQPALFSPAGETKTCSPEEALRRAQEGIISAVQCDHFTGAAPNVRVSAASLQYDTNYDGSRLIPVWLLEGEIVECFVEDFVVETEDGSMRRLEADETDLLTPELLKCTLAVPAAQ